MKKLFLVFLFLTSFNLLGYGQSDSIVNHKINSLIKGDHFQNRKDVLSIKYFPLIYNNSVDVVVTIDDATSNRDSQGQIILTVSNENGNIVNSAHYTNGEMYKIVSNLSLNTSYQISAIYVNSSGVSNELLLNNTTINTAKSKEINLSATFYNKLTKWSSNSYQDIDLIDYIENIVDQDNGLKNEAIYFLQNHFKVNSLVKSQGSNLSSYFAIWPPVIASIAVPDTNEVSLAECLCSFILNTDRDVVPGLELAISINDPNNIYNGMTILPEVISAYSGAPEETSYLFEGSGAAKRLTLSMKGKHSSKKYRVGSFGDGTNAPETSPTYSRISYNLFCSGHTDKNLPADCVCEKEIKIGYEYTTHLKSSANGGWFAWNRGEEATAEDHAFVYVRNGAEIDVLAAGQARVATHCESNWNSDFWTNVPELLVEIAKIAVDTNSTAVDWVGLGDDIINIMTTSFRTSEGDCTNRDESGVLISGEQTIYSSTNKPVDIVLASLSHASVRGYGKWDARASIVSDYSLSAILLGDDLVNEDCCTDKVGDYFVGYFNDYIVNFPPFGNIKIRDGSINDGSSVKDKATRGFSLWGPFDDLERDFTGKYILENDYGHFIQESPGCIPIHGFIGNPLNPQGTKLNHDHVLYPNPATNNISISGEIKSYIIYDIMGKTVVRGSKLINKEIDISDLDIGQYIIKLETESNIITKKFIKI